MSAVQSAYSQAVFTSLGFVQTYGNGKDRRTLYQTHSYPKNFLAVLEEMGNVRGSGGEAEIFHLEDDWLTDNIIVGSIVTPAAAANDPITIALGVANMVDKNGTKFSYPQENQIIRLPGTGEEVYVAQKITTANPHQLVLRPVDPTVNLNGKITAAMTLALTGNAYAEGTYGAKSVIDFDNRVANYFQIFKKTYAATGTSLTLSAPYKVETAAGATTKHVLRFAENSEKRHRIDISNTLLVGKKSMSHTQTSGLTGDATAVYKTEGYWEAVNNRGKTLQHGGTFDLTDWDAASAIVETARVGADVYVGFLGFKLQMLIENALYQVGVSNAGVFDLAATKFKPEVMDGYKAEDFFAWIGFNGIKKGQVSYLFNKLHDFSDPKGLGSTGYEFPFNGILAPYSIINNKGKKLNTPSIGAEYRELDGYSRRMQVVKTGSADLVTPTNSLDAKQYDLLSEMGGDWGLLTGTIALKN